MTDELTGKVAWVTGASQGIVRATAVALARAGADVAVNFRTHEAEAKEVCAQIKRCGRRAVVLKADVSVAREVTALVGVREQARSYDSSLVRHKPRSALPFSRRVLLCGS